MTEFGERKEDGDRCVPNGERLRGWMVSEASFGSVGVVGHSVDASGAVARRSAMGRSAEGLNFPVDIDFGEGESLSRELIVVSAGGLKLPQGISG